MVCVSAEKEEIDHPNNSFSPCSIHDRKCLQKQQAKRVNNGNKMRSNGSPHHREDTRVMVSTQEGWGGQGGCSRVEVLGLWARGMCQPRGQLSLPFPQAQGSCQSELHRALERLAASQTRTHEDLYVIPIPNCDRNGNFHPKQVGWALAYHGGLGEHFVEPE